MQKTVTNGNPVLERRKSVRRTRLVLRFCRKGLAVLQRSPYGLATGLPLHDNNGPGATPQGLYGSEIHDILARKNVFLALKSCTDFGKTG